MGAGRNAVEEVESEEVGGGRMTEMSSSSVIPMYCKQKLKIDFKHSNKYLISKNNCESIKQRRRRRKRNERKKRCLHL